ncbi:MAG: glycosyltransferase [bacterium]
MKVLFLNYEFPPIGGGGANATRYFFKEFSTVPDLEIDLVTASWNSPGIENFSPNIRLHKLDIHKKRLHYWTHREVIEYLFKAYTYSRSLIKKTEYDLCHAFFGFPSGLVAYRLRKKLPYIVSLRGSDVPGFNNRFSWEYVFLTPLFKKIWSRSREVVANSRGLKLLAAQTAPLQEIGIIYNGIDTGEFAPQENRPAEADEFNIITVSRLIERKGLDYLIKALPEIPNPRTKLTIIGEGNLQNKLKLLARELGVYDRVDFPGFVEHRHLPEYYRNADLFVLPSKNEGMSNTVLEAMACALPVITTDTGGTDELIRDNGIIIPMEDSGAISRAVREIMTDAGLRKKMSGKSRESALEFGWHKQAMKYLALYRKIVA